MSLLRSFRGLSIVALLAAMLMALLPLGGFASMPMAQNEAATSQMPDCGMCPKAADMVMINCAQGLCGLPAVEAASLTTRTIDPVCYAPVLVAIPPGRYTIPPVSPG